MTLFDFAVWFAQLCFALAIICAMIRLVCGPSAQDRILALDAMYISAMLSLLLLGIRSGTTLFFEIALLIALFGFVGSAALAKFLLQGEVIEP